MGNPLAGEVWARSRAHLNDTKDTKYHDSVLRSFTCDALDELEDSLHEISSELFGDASADLVVPANTTLIKYTGTTPVLPSNLVEIKEIWEKPSGTNINQFVPIGKVTQLRPQGSYPSLDEYVWESQSIKFLGALTARDIRIFFEKGFPPLTDPADPQQEIPYNRALPFLAYKTSALAAELIAQNHSRAVVLHQSAEVALERALNVRVRAMPPGRHRPWQRQTRRGGAGRTIERTR